MLDIAFLVFGIPALYLYCKNFSTERRNIFRIFMENYTRYRVSYVCDWGVYEYRYDYADMLASRPIHETMSIAPPWAKIQITKKQNTRQ